MDLYIGGYAQGKLSYVQEKYKGQDRTIINDLHLWVKQLLAEGKPAEEIVMEFYKEHSDCVFICDEIGNGIVPMEKEEREYKIHPGYSGYVRIECICGRWCLCMKHPCRKI